MDFNLDEFEIDDITPAPKKKRKADGGQKGKRGERELCKIFTKRFGKEFTRTIGSWKSMESGGFDAIPRKKYLHGRYMCP